MLVSLEPTPDQFAPIAQKETESYGKQLARSLYSRWQVGISYSPFSALGYFQTMNDYYEGNQDMAQYIARYRGTSPVQPNGSAGSRQGGGVTVPNGGFSDGLRKGFNNISFVSVSPMPKFMGTVEAVLNESDYKVDVQGTAPDPMRQRDIEKWRMWVGTKFANPMRKNMGLPLKNFGFEPQNRQELDVYERLHGFKLPFEVGLQRGLDHTFAISRWNELHNQFKKSALQNKYICGRVKPNKEGAVVIEYISAGNFVTATLEKQKYEESPWAGHVYRITIEELALKLKEKGVSDSAIMSIAQKNSASNFIGDINNFDYERRDPVTNRYLWYDWFVPVFHFECRSTDVVHYSKYTKKDGTTVFTKLKAQPAKDEYGNPTYKYNPRGNNREDEVTTKTEENIYEGDWVIGTEYILNYGKQKNILRNSDGTCALSYFFVSVDGVPMVQRLKTYIDEHQMAFLKFQAEILANAPSGHAYDMSILSNITLAGEAFTPFQNIQMMLETGNLFVNTSEVMLRNRISPKDAVIPLDMPLEKAREWLNIMQSMVAQMRSVSGISEIMDAGSSEKPELVGIAQLERISSTNALFPIKEGLRYIKERIAEKVVAKMRLLIEFSPRSRKYYEGVIGENYVREITKYKDLSLNSIGLILRAAPTQERKRFILETAQMALQNSKNGSGTALIDYDDFLYIETLVEQGYLDLARAVISTTIQRNKAAAQQQAQAAQQQVIQGQQNSALVAEQAKAQAKAAEIAAQGEQDRLNEIEARKTKLEVEKAKHEGVMEEIELEGIIESSQNVEISGKI